MHIILHGDAKNKTLEDWHSVNSWQLLSWKYSIKVVSIRFAVTTNVQSLMLQWHPEHCYSICTTGMLTTRTRCLTIDKSALLSGATSPTASAYGIAETPTGLYMNRRWKAKWECGSARSTTP